MSEPCTHEHTKRVEWFREGREAGGEQVHYRVMCTDCGEQVGLDQQTIESFPG